MRDALSATLEAALLREIARVWRERNAALFDARMAPPAVALSDGAGQLGTWRSESRTIALSRRFVREARWGEVVAVLEHEMAHQYTSEVLGAPDVHGPVFREVCAVRGIDPRAGGVPHGDTPAPAVVRRVKALLALADSPNPHEAEAAARAAHRLMRRHNLSTLEAEAERGYASRQVGPAKGRFDPWEKRIGAVLGRHFFVDAIWVPVWLVDAGRRGRALELCGAHENLELAVWVHDFLRVTGERLWRHHKRAHGIRGDAERRRFLHGVIAGFDARLREEARACEAEGLVWVGDPGLTGFVRRRHRHLRTTGIAVRGGEAFRHGQSAGRALTLRRPVEAGERSRGRLIEG